MHTHFRAFSRKFFEKNFALHLFPLREAKCTPYLKKFIPSLIWNWEVETHPVFKKNFEKYFLFGCGTAYFTYLKSPFTYLEFECKNATCFSEKIFLKRSFVLKTYPHLFPLGEGVWGQ